MREQSLFSNSYVNKTFGIWNLMTILTTCVSVPPNIVRPSLSPGVLIISSKAGAPADSCLSITEGRASHIRGVVSHIRGWGEAPVGLCGWWGQGAAPRLQLHSGVAIVWTDKSSRSLTLEQWPTILISGLPVKAFIKLLIPRSGWKFDWRGVISRNPQSKRTRTDGPCC